MVYKNSKDSEYLPDTEEDYSSSSSSISKQLDMEKILVFSQSTRKKNKLSKKHNDDSSYSLEDDIISSSLTEVNDNRYKVKKKNKKRINKFEYSENYDNKDNNIVTKEKVCVEKQNKLIKKEKKPKILLDTEFNINSDYFYSEISKNDKKTIKNQLLSFFDNYTNLNNNNINNENIIKKASIELTNTIKLQIPLLYKHESNYEYLKNVLDNTSKSNLEYILSETKDTNTNNYQNIGCKILNKFNIFKYVFNNTNNSNNYTNNNNISKTNKILINYLKYKNLNNLFSLAYLEFKPTIRECYFFPNKLNEIKVANILRTAKKTLDIAIFAFTNDAIGAAIEEVHSRKNVKIRLIADDECAKFIGGEVYKLASLGIETKTDNSARFHMHNKFAIIDNSVIVTGSFNWTSQAVKYNQENILFLECPNIAQQYTNYFNSLWNEFIITIDKKKALILIKEQEERSKKLAEARNKAREEKKRLKLLGKKDKNI